MPVSPVYDEEPSRAAWQDRGILVAREGGSEYARAQEAGTYLPVYFSARIIGSTVGADRSGDGEIYLKSAYRDGTTHVVFDRGGLPSLVYIAKLAALVPRPRTNLTRYLEAVLSVKCH